MKYAICELCGTSFDAGYGDFSEWWKLTEIASYESWIAKACDGCIYKIEMSIPGERLTAEWVQANAHKAKEHHFMTASGDLVTVKCIICDVLNRDNHATCGHWKSSTTYIKKTRLH